MASAGSISQMIQTIRFNKSLLSNRRAFGELREHINRRIEKKSGLTIPEIDPELLKEIKLQIRKELTAERRRNLVIKGGLFSTGFLLLSWVIYSFYSVPIMVNDSSFVYEQEKAIQKRVRAEEQFNYYISDGFNWLKKNKFHNAIFQFELAIKKHPENYQANLGLSLTLWKQCELEKINCKKAYSQTSRLINRLKNHPESRQVISNYLLDLGDTNNAVLVLAIPIK